MTAAYEFAAAYCLLSCGACGGVEIVRLRCACGAQVCADCWAAHLEAHA